MSLKHISFFIKGVFALILCIIFLIYGNMFLGWKISFVSTISLSFLYWGLAIVSALLFLLERKKIIENIENGLKKDHEDLHNRETNFKKEYPDISTNRFGRNIILPIYKQGIYALLFVVISAIFVWVKSPYINIPFSGPFHAAKYAAYVEPAKRMQEHGPFWYQKNYLRTTAGNPFKYDGTYKTFSSYPILEWILAGTQELFPLESYEHNARVVMTIIGIILLLTCYVFLQRFFTRKQILFLITLLALNSVFQFFTHLTVLDPINLIFFFIALHILLNGLDSGDVKKLYLAGVLAGIGINIKYHAIIFYLPLFLSLLYLYKKNSSSTTLSNLLIVVPNFVLQTIFFWISVRYFPTNWYVFLPITLLMIGVQIFLYKKSEQIYKTIKHFVEKIEVTNLYTVGAILIIIAIFLVFNVSQFAKMGKDFMTDSYLIFNRSMYQKLFFFQERSVAPLFFYIGFVFVVLANLVKIPKNYKLLINTIFITAVVYVVLISKVSYFHIYYHNIPVISLIIISSMIFLLFELYRYQIIGYSLAIISLISFGLWNTNVLSETISTYDKDIKDIGNFLKYSTKKDEAILYNNLFKEVISLYSERTTYFLMDNTAKQFSKDIASGLTFLDITKKYNIKFFAMCPAANADIKWFYNLYYPETKKVYYDENLPLRTRRILCIENGTHCESVMGDTQYTQEMVDFFDKNIGNHLFLVKQIGNCAVYSIQ